MKKKFILVLLLIFFSITFIILYSSLHKVEIYIPEKITNKSIDATANNWNGGTIDTYGVCKWNGYCSII